MEKDGFGFLAEFWPDLADLGRRAERAEGTDPDTVAVRLRSFVEVMVGKLISRLDLPVDPQTSLFNRLDQIKQADLLDARVLKKLHSIRTVGNRGAHGEAVSNSRATSILDDAWSLACWFCNFMRPDLTWSTPSKRGGGEVAPFDASPPNSPIDTNADRQPTGSARPENVFKFPEERILRVRAEVARAMAELKPEARSVRTRITIQEAFPVSLSSDQAACLERLQEFLFDDQQQIFLLKGYAGTGKTFLAKGVADYLSALGRDFRIAAPTGRAAKVISEKTERSARTVHSLIYDFGDVREYKAGDTEPGSETYKIHAQIARNRDQVDTVYIIDEASLLSDVYSESEFFQSGSGFLLRDLLSFVGLAHEGVRRKIIFIGDPAQLPPVRMSESPALDGEYLRREFGLRAVEFELKEVLRQKAESGVIKNVMPLREGLAKKSFGSLPLSYDDDVQRMRADEVIPVYMEIPGDGRAANTIVITESNGLAMEYNRSIRSSLFPGRDVVVPGDRLIVTANTFADGIYVANGEFIDVVGVDEMVELRTTKVTLRNKETSDVEEHVVVLAFRDIRVALRSEPDGDVVVNVKILDEHLHGGRALSTVQQRALYIDFLKRHPDLKKGDNRISQVLRQDPYFNALRVRFGYAVTCHKAQGGEWENVIVDCSSSQNPRTSNYFRWLYTALTRSSSKLYLVNPPEPRIKLVGAWPHLGEGEDPKLPTLDGFRLSVRAAVQRVVDGQGIVIVDVAHHQNQEAFFFQRGFENARINIGYDGRAHITNAKRTADGQLPMLLENLLQSMSGLSPTALASFGLETEDQGPARPKRPFLGEFHDRLLAAVGSREIRVVDLEEQEWCQRYTFERGQERANVDVIYNGRETMKSCRPSPGKRFNTSAQTLLPDIIDILTKEIRP